MGVKDIVTKDYTDDNRIFADAFNLLVYEGETVIRPEKLKKLDSVMIGVPYGADGALLPVQKFRDGLKCLTAMEDDEAVYLLLGLENQTGVHYAMPVRDMLYDALQYASQVEKAAKSRKEARKPAKQSGKNISSAEYLSGFSKVDKLVPIITAVLYFSDGEWDGPLTLHEMMATQDPKILSFVSDYKINLITPQKTPDEEIDRLTSSLREVMFFIKYSRDRGKLTELLQTDPRFRHMERKAANVVKTVTGMQFKVEDEEETVDMCQALREIVEDATSQGIQQGIQQIALRMLKEGSSSIEFIVQMTGMSVDEVQALVAGK